jgi:hypothetical protein
MPYGENVGESEKSKIKKGAYRWCWGTIDEADERVWNPLLVEMITSASVLLEWWDRKPDHALRAAVKEGLAAKDERSARVATAFLVGLSRVGEANPWRQESFGGEGPASPRGRAGAVWQEEARAAGLPLPGVGARPRLSRRMPSEHVTAAVLPGLIGCDCAGAVHATPCREPDHQGLYAVALALNRQGADVLHADTVAKAARATGGPDWDGVRAALADAVARYVGITARDLPRLIHPSGPERLTDLTALVAQSTGLAREVTARGFASPHDPWELVVERARQSGEEVVQRLCGAG